MNNLIEIKCPSCHTTIQTGRKFVKFEGDIPFCTFCHKPGLEVKKGNKMFRKHN